MLEVLSDEESSEVSKPMSKQVEITYAPSATTRVERRDVELFRVNLLLKRGTRTIIRIVSRFSAPAPFMTLVSAAPGVIYGVQEVLANTVVMWVELVGEEEPQTATLFVELLDGLGAVRLAE